MTNYGKFLNLLMHGVKPAVVLCYTDIYPSSAAGGILAHGNSGDKNYHAAVSGQDKSAWAPFKSRKDWEVALWAKLRGPGSTAFSDLLAVPGVRFTLIHLELLKKLALAS